MAYPGLKPDFPKIVSTSEGCSRTYAYRGPAADLPLISYGIIYLGHPVQSASLEKVDVADLYDLTIVTLQKVPPLDEDGNIVDTPEGDEGSVFVAPPVEVGAPSEVVDGQYPFYEIEWTPIEKALRQHPAFKDFSASDWTAVDFWEKETDLAAKAAFQYYARNKDGEAIGGLLTLSDVAVGGGANAKSPKKYAELRLFGVDSFLDAAPVSRKNSRFRGWNAPTTGDAGQKSAEDPFDGVPDDYLWLKTADRSSKQGQGSEWIQQQEWTGARIILLDKDKIYL